MKKKSFVWLIGFVFLLFVFKSSLFSTVYGSISGRVTDENGKPLEKVKVKVEGEYYTKSTTTDKDGKYSFRMLEPGEYEIFFYPSHPYFDPEGGKVYSVKVQPGKTVIFNKLMSLGGSISGKVIKKDGTPFSGVSVEILGPGGGYEEVSTGEDGKFFVGGLRPSDNYLLIANCNIPGYAYKVVQNVKVERGKETKDITIVFDLDDITGIEGYVTSSIDGKPLAEIEISVYLFEEYLEEVGKVVSGKDGYYYIRNLDPGNYNLSARPPMEEKYSYGEWSKLCKDKDNVSVEKGKKTRVDFQLDIPSQSSNL
jgi:hypothetical protein